MGRRLVRLSVRGHRLLALVGAFALASILLIPIWLWQLPWGDDIISHYNWTRALLGQWLADPGYHRWLTSYNDGLGNPDFFFYPPLSTYVAVWLGALLPAADPSTGIKLAALLGLALSGWAAYLCLCDYVESRAASVAAALYMLLPYHLSIDFFWRTALAEFWSFVWMPLILMGLGRMVRGGSRWGWLGVAFGYCMLILTHMPTTLFFSCFMVAVVLGTAGGGHRFHLLLQTLAVMAIGAGLAAFYLVPAMWMQQFTNMVLLWKHPITESLLAIPPAVPGLAKSGWLMNLPVRLYAVAFSTTLLAIVAYLLSVKGQSSAPARRLAHVWMALTLGALFLTLGPSAILWERLPLLYKVQIPWRILSVVTLGTAVLVALWLNRRQLCGPVALDSVGFLLMGVLVMGWLADLAWLGQHRTRYAADRFSVAADSRLNNCEFIPIWVRDGGAGYNPTLVCDGRKRADGLVVPAPSEPFVSGIRGSARLLTKQGAEMAIDVVAEDAATLTLPLLFFPIWEARDINSGRVLALAPGDAQGLVEVKIDRGASRLLTRRIFHRSEVVGMALSAASVALLIGIIGWQRRRQVVAA